MKNKTGAILKTLIEELKKNEPAFGVAACAQTHGTNFVLADIATENKGKTEAYRIIVIKHAV